MSFALSCKCKYALSALIELATVYASGYPLQSREIARRQNIPDRYLEQVLATLKRGGLVRSQRGVNGGYLLALEPSSVSVLDVIQCVDGSKLDRSVPSPEPSADATLESTIVCEIWLEARESMELILSQYSLKDVIDKRDVRQHASVMYYI